MEKTRQEDPFEHDLANLIAALEDFKEKYPKVYKSIIVLLVYELKQEKNLCALLKPKVV